MKKLLFYKTFLHCIWHILMKDKIARNSFTHFLLIVF